MSSLEGENMHTQYKVLSYKSDMYFHDYKLAIEIDEKGHKDRNIDQKIKRQKIIEQELGCKFIRTDLEKGELDIFWAINQTFRHIKQLIKKTLKSKVSTRLLGLEFKSDNITKSKDRKIYCQKNIGWL